MSIPTDRVADFTRDPQKMLIGGEWLTARSGETIEVIDPATGRVCATAAAGGAEDIDAAVRAARAAFDKPSWTNMPPSRRRKLLTDLADAIEADSDLLARLETLNNGMPLAVSRMFGIGFAVETLRYIAGWVGKLNGEVYTASFTRNHVYSVKEPVGVVGAIIPWNGPIGMTAEHIAAAVATGCVLILKPAELTPLTAIRIGQLAQQVGFPAGVVNIVTGYGAAAGAALVDHPDVDKITFTGSTNTGRTVLRAAAATLKRTTLELGGKSPVIVFPDADIERAIVGAAAGVFSNTGQICVAGSRLYVHDRVFDRVVEGIAAKGRSLSIGSGFTEGTQIGPLISAQQLQRVQGYISAGLAQGATLVSGGNRVGENGYFIEPTVLAGTTRKMSVVQDEIFGPVVCAMRFDDRDLDRIAAVANDTTFGLASYIWTRDLSVAHSLARRIRAGSIVVNGGPMLDVNVPSGGFKQSGLGRQRGRQGLEAYLETKTVTVVLDEPPEPAQTR